MSSNSDKKNNVKNSIHYNLHISEPWFTYIKNGQKIAEGRPKKGKFNNYKVGDILTIFNNKLNSNYNVEIIEILKYNTFYEMLKDLGIENVLPGIKTLDDGVNVYRQWYSEDVEKKFHVIAIKIKLLDKENNKKNKKFDMKRLTYYDDKIKKKLEENIQNLVIGRGFRYIGTFAHKMKYVTDIDISNFVYSKKCESFEYFVYTRIVEIVKNLPKDINLLYLTTGFHPDLIPTWSIKKHDIIENYDHEHTTKMLKLLKKYDKIDKKMYKEFKSAKEPNIKTLILLEELLEKRSRVYWSAEEVLKGEKIMFGRQFYLKEKLFQPPLKNFFRFLWKYSKTEYILVDVSLYYKGDLDCIKSFKNYVPPPMSNWQRDKRVYLMYYNNEYYWLLRETRYLFKQLLRNGLIDDRQFETYFGSVVNITEIETGKYKFLYNKLLDYYKLLRNEGVEIKILDELIQNTLDDIIKYVLDKKTVKLAKEFKKQCLKIDGSKKIEYLKNMAGALNDYLNNMMYDEMIKYYSIIFDLDPTVISRLPPITSMKKPGRIKIVKKYKEKYVIDYLNYRYF